jgi:hypothetical protein
VPTCGSPVGDGAMRTRTGRVSVDEVDVSAGGAIGPGS